MSTPVARLRQLGSAAAIAAILAAILVIVTPTSARADSWNVSNASEFKTAVEEANAGSPYEEHTITLTSNFTWDYTVPVEYTNTATLVIEGNGFVVTLDDDAASFLHVSGGSGVEILHLTITGNNVARTQAIKIEGDWVVLDEVIIAGVWGTKAAVEIEATGQVFLYSSTFSDNRSTADDGGALSIDTDIDAWIEDSVFEDNKTVGNYGGGALAIRSVNPNRIVKSHFANNTAVYHGGAIYAADASLWIYDSTFEHNSTDRNGGAVYVESGSAEMANSVFLQNIAMKGGAVYANSAVFAYASTYAQNDASETGGAIYTSGTNINGSFIASSTFDANFATLGGGAFYGRNNDVTVEYSTFTGNIAHFGGAHVHKYYGDIYTYASVFAGGGYDSGCWADNATVSAGYNFDADGTCSNGATGDFGAGESPLLQPLANNGGGTPTRLPETGSPVLDVIDPETCALDLASVYSPWDQRGVDRRVIVDAGGSCDIGALEVVTSVSFTIEGLQGDVDFTVDGAYLHFDACDDVFGIEDAPAGAPAGVTFPHGLISFCVASGAPGSTVTVTVTFPSPVNRAFKVENSGWQQIPGASFDGKTLTYQVTDGGPLDLDGEADGYIVDPLAAGVGAAFTG